MFSKTTCFYLTIIRLIKKCWPEPNALAYYTKT